MMEVKGIFFCECPQIKCAIFGCSGIAAIVLIDHSNIRQCLLREGIANFNLLTYSHSEREYAQK